MAKKKKIHGFDELEQEIARLQKRSIDLEDVLLDRVDHFRDNYKKMALNSIIPGSGKHTSTLSTIGHIAKVAWKTGKFKNFATGAIVAALEFFGVQLGIKLFNKFAKSRKEKNEPDFE